MQLHAIHRLEQKKQRLRTTLELPKTPAPSGVGQWSLGRNEVPLSVVILGGTSSFLIVQTAPGDECHHHVKGTALLVRAFAKVLEGTLPTSLTTGKMRLGSVPKADRWIWGLMLHTSLVNINIVFH